MKLTIKNYKKIIGQHLEDTDWMVCDVSETDEWYCFSCMQTNTNTRPFGHISNIRLRRDGIKEGEWKYRFWHTTNQSYHQITADWFADMDNARSAIAIELRKL
jgi:hypothetical protein